MEGTDRVLDLLRRRGLMSGKEIQRELGISQPVMSRLIKEAGPRVCRLGRSVATRYALPREIIGLGQRTPVFRLNDQGSVTEQGILHWLAEGRCWFERSSGDHQWFPGMPPFVEDMRPQGYIGRGFPALHPDLRLPGRVTDWNDDQQLIALALRGEDCVGNLIIGEESLNRFLARSSVPRTRADYAALASGSLVDQPGSSAGGEHPKFAIRSGDRHLLVKFASGDGVVADRWRDLLVAEHLALEVLHDIGFEAPHTEWLDLEGSRYLELERFDRVGPRGRRGVISLAALNGHFLGFDPVSWTQASRQILSEPTLDLSEADADAMIWLDTFGDLIGNTDRHFGNLSFYAEEASTLDLSLAPVYDMLPMVFAPVATNLVARQFTPRPPNTRNREIWREVATLAGRYWACLSDATALSSDFRRLAADCQATLARHIDRYS